MTNLALETEIKNTLNNLRPRFHKLGITSAHAVADELKERGSANTHPGVSIYLEATPELWDEVCQLVTAGNRGYSPRVVTAFELVVCATAATRQKHHARFVCSEPIQIASYVVGKYLRGVSQPKTFDQILDSLAERVPSKLQKTNDGIAPDAPPCGYFIAYNNVDGPWIMVTVLPPLTPQHLEQQALNLNLLCSIINQLGWSITNPTVQNYCMAAINIARRHIGTVMHQI